MSECTKFDDDKRKENRMKIAYFTLLLIFIVGIYALMSYLFQICWNSGVSPALGAQELEFSTSTHLVGLLTLAGYFFRGWGASAVKKNSENLFKD